MTGEGMIHIVDDEEAIRDALSFLFTSRGVDSRGWPSGAAFLAAQPLADCACIILDVRMPDLSGPETFQRLRALGNTAPVIFLTGHADVPTAVDTVKRGAFDFCEKPFSVNALVDRIEQALAVSEQWLQAAAQQEAVRTRLTELTERERAVMAHVLEGLLNKQIAAQLGMSEPTVKQHRAQVMRKMEASTLAALVRSMERLMRGTEGISAGASGTNSVQPRD